MKKKHNILTRIGRAFKLNYVKLLRSSGGAKKVALGFAIGFALEMLVISTASLIYILFVPVVRIARGSLPASIIGNIIGKLTFLPVILLPFARKIGKMIFPMRVHASRHAPPFSFKSLLHGDFHSMLHLLHGGVHVLIGMTIFGIGLGIISYFLVYYLYEREKQRRVNVRKNNKSHNPLLDKTSIENG